MSQPSVQLDRAVRDRLVSMARTALPNEMCGLLYGTGRADWSSAGPLRVEGVVSVLNSAQSPVSFVLDPIEMLEAEATIEGKDRVVLGIVHSHPTSAARPSAQDCVDAMSYDPQAVFVHVVVSMQGFAPRIKAWRIVEDDPSTAIELHVATDEA